MKSIIAEDIYLALLNDIQAGEIPGGSHVKEDAIASRFSASRTPVREAMRRLAQDGLLERQPRGHVVTQLSPKQISEIYGIASALEALAAREAAVKMTATSLRPIQEIHGRMLEAAQENDSLRFIRLNTELHAAIVTASANDSLRREIARYSAIMRQYRSASLTMPGRMAEAVKEHEAVIEALLRRDGPAAETAMRQHMERARDLLITVLTVAFGAADLTDTLPPTVQPPTTASRKE